MVCMKNKNTFTFPKPITLKICVKDYLENTKKKNTVFVRKG